MADFLDALIKARNQYEPDDCWRVVVESHDREFVTAGGSTFAIEKDGNICGLCRNKRDSLHGSEILRKAVLKGGTKLQAFGKRLFKFYTKNGFMPISWVKFDPKMAPPDWMEQFCEEPLIFYAYDATMLRGPLSFISFVFMEKPCATFEEAYAKRDNWIKERSK